MTDPVPIVYPDANEDAGSLLKGELGDRLRAVGPFEIHYGQPDSIEIFIERIGDARGILLGWRLPVEALLAAPKLEMVSFTGIGVSNYLDLSAARKRGITVTNTPGYADNTVAEHALALLFALARHIPRQDRDVRAGGWRHSPTGIELRGKTLGLIGFGGIGARLADLARGIGMTVVAWTRNPDPSRGSRHGVVFQDLDTVLSTSDALSINVALAAETTGLIGVAELARTRPGVLLVNTARGPIVSEDALISALRSGQVAGAGLDVFDIEPLPAGHPLLGLDNVILTPHVAYNTFEGTYALYSLAIDNLASYFAGRPQNVVNP